MGSIGIIANPAAGKDIRRVVGSALVVNNQQKLNFLDRMLMSLDIDVVDQVWVMPEIFGFGRRLSENLFNKTEMAGKIDLVEMMIENAAVDTLRAAEWMAEKTVDCIVVLGGDGTTRLVSKACGNTPIFSISTGTNNVIPQTVEGTVAGLGLSYFLSLPIAERDAVIIQHKVLKVLRNEQLIDQALVDIATLSGDHVGSRAVWDADTLRQVFVTRASPMSTGISSIIGMNRIIPVDSDQGYLIEVGKGGNLVSVPMVPGRLVDVMVNEGQVLLDENIYAIVPERPLILALDGERELVLFESDERWNIQFSINGPLLIDLTKLMIRGVESGYFHHVVKK